jgi:hypothetical protein
VVFTAPEAFTYSCLSHGWCVVCCANSPHATKEGLRNMITALEEFMRLPNPPKRDDGPTLKERKDLDGMWGLFDLDGSGELDRYEFKLAMAMLNIHTNLGFLEVYNALDTDGNGTISKDEFAVWCARLAKLPRVCTKRLVSSPGYAPVTDYLWLKNPIASTLWARTA